MPRQNQILRDGWLEVWYYGADGGVCDPTDAGLLSNLVCAAAVVRHGVLPNFPPIISRVRRLFRPPGAVAFPVL